MAPKRVVTPAATAPAPAVDQLVLQLETREWLQIYSQENGILLLAVRVFFVCMAGGAAGLCGALQVATNSHLPGQEIAERVYCRVCGARYRAGFGMLNEIWFNDRIYWLRSMPPEGMQLVVAPQEEMVAEVVPQVNEEGMIRLPRVDELWQGPQAGLYMLRDPAAYNEMREWTYEAVISFARHL